MKVYTVERMDKYDYDFSVEIKKGGCYSDRNKALKRARELYERMCGEYEDEMLRYPNENKYPGVFDSLLDVEEDSEYGYYRISFGLDENYECHSVAVEEWEMED